VRQSQSYQSWRRVLRGLVPRLPSLQAEAPGRARGRLTHSPRRLDRQSRLEMPRHPRQDWARRALPNPGARP